MRVQIPSYTSHYLKGERTGTVVKTGWLRDLGPDRKGKLEIARVKLDRSGATILVDFGDCRPIGEPS
jgi:hypothetical protein